MANLLKYSKYERPDGYGPSSPIVYVRKNVISDVGMPIVNYDGVEELLHGKLQVPTSVKPKIKLYGGSRAKRAIRGVADQTVPADMMFGSMSRTRTPYMSTPPPRLATITPCLYSLTKGNI